MKKFLEKHSFFIGFAITLLILIFCVLGRNDEDVLVTLREARGMVLIEEGLVYNEETRVLYQEVPIYGQYTINGFYVPFYNENGEVILFND